MVGDFICFLGDVMVLVGDFSRLMRMRTDEGFFFDVNMGRDGRFCEILLDENKSVSFPKKRCIKKNPKQRSPERNQSATP